MVQLEKDRSTASNVEEWVDDDGQEADRRERRTRREKRHRRSARSQWFLIGVVVGAVSLVVVFILAWKAVVGLLT